MNPYLNTKLSILSIISIIGVLIIHSYYLEAEFSPCAFYLQKLVNRHLEFCVPLFFAISGYLLFYLLKTAALNYLYKVELKINLLQYFTSAYAQWVPSAVGVTLVAAYGVSHIPLSNWVTFVPASAAVAGLYVLVCWLFWFNSEEKGVFTTI